MNTIDVLWQRLLDEECDRLRALTASELKALPPCSKRETGDGAEEIRYVLWHENPADSHNLKFHSFVLQANRKSILYYKNYLAGFALDEDDALISIDDEILARYD